MTPIIIETNNQNYALDYLKEEKLLPHLVYEIDTTKNIGVDDIKAMLHQASYRLEQLQLYLIKHAEKLTLPAQNMLLKTLEEASTNQLFVLIAPTRFKLLETVVSRCQIISLNQKEEVTQEETKNFLKIIKTITISPTACINLTDELVKNEPQDIIKNFILYLQKSNRDLPTIKRLKIINYALTCLSDLQRNINSKLTLDHFLLKSHQLITMKAA